MTIILGILCSILITGELFLIGSLIAYIVGFILVKCKKNCGWSVMATSESIGNATIIVMFIVLAAFMIIA